MKDFYRILLKKLSFLRQLRRLNWIAFLERVNYTFQFIHKNLNYQAFLRRNTKNK